MTDVHKMLRVKPAVEGEVVRVPERKMRQLAAAGELVPGNAYWHRRLALGDVVLAEDEQAGEGTSEETEAEPGKS